MKRTKFLSRAWANQHLYVHNQYQGRRVREGVSHDSWLVTIGTLEPCRQGCVFWRACSAAAA